MKLSKKISSFLLSSFFMLNLGIAQSKAEWVTIEDNISKSKVIDRHKSNWCWAHSGAKMLEYLGIKGKQAAHVAISAGHNLTSDNAEDISRTVWAVKDILPEGHPLKNLDIHYFYCGQSYFGMLIKPDTILNENDENLILPNGNRARMGGEMVNAHFSESEFLRTSLEKGRPVLAKLTGGVYGNVGHIVVITGIDWKNFSMPQQLSMLPKELVNIYFPDGIPAYTINKIRYWDSNRGEVIEDFTQSFANKVASYAGFDINA